MDCLDCFYCKVRLDKGILRCSQRHWRKDDMVEKVIKLTKTEIASFRNGSSRIGWRDLFSQGKTCFQRISNT